MNNKKIYISGQISGLTERAYKLKFHQAAVFLYENWCDFDDNRIVINPLDIKPLFGIKKWFFFMVTDIWQLIKCDEIYMLNNWENSLGAKIEHKIAKMLKMKIVYQK